MQVPGSPPQFYDRFFKYGFQPYKPKVEEIQYVNPAHHRNCLEYIAEYGRELLTESLNKALALAVKVDGQVDAHQVQICCSFYCNN